MSLLRIDDLSHSFGEKELYAHASFELNPREHMGVVGQNGSGKSTLLRILLGQISPTAGHVAWQPGLSLGHIDQYADVDGALSIDAYLQTAFEPLYRAERSLQELYLSMESGVDPGRLKRMETLQARLDEGDFYTIPTRTARVAAGLGLPAIGMDRPLRSLSGGQRTKVILAKLLLAQPDVLLLDEPTNFLDTAHIDWLTEYLTAFPGSFVIVSHDYAFLDRITNCIVDIEFQSIRKYHGRYSDFVRQKAQRREAHVRLYAAQQREVERLTSYIEKNKARASTARMAKSRQKQLDRMELLTAPSSIIRPHPAFIPAAVRAGHALTVRELLIGYASPLLPRLRFTVEAGETVAVTGFNGIGKSTLLKTLAGKLPALGGSFAFDLDTRMGYFEQDMNWETPGSTPLEILSREFPDVPHRSLRRALARCGVTPQHAMRPVASLSGGEQNKVKLCRLTLVPYNFLLLDEPTNHLDAETKEALKEAIEAFPGTVLLVCHEPEFYREQADRVVDIERILGGGRGRG